MALRFALVLAITLATTSLTIAQNTNATAATDWKEESDAKGVKIFSRVRSGSPLKEFRAVGLIDASAALVFAVIDDAEAYTTFMPYTAEVRVLKRSKDSTLVYQRLDLPLISDRDYTVLSKHETSLSADGPIYRIRWEPANELGPPAKAGIQRVSLCEGGWLLESQGKEVTRATYTIYTDSGGNLPAFIANNGSRIAIRKLFEAVRKQVKDPKYSVSKN